MSGNENKATTVEEDIADDAMSMLTEEERAALSEGDYLEDFEDQGDDAGAADDEAAQQAATGDTESDEAAEHEPTATPKVDPDPGTPNVNLGELDEQIAGFADQRAELLASYDDGDLTGAELNEKLGELDEAKDALVQERAVAAHQIEQVNTSWKGAVETYLEAFPGLKSDENVLKAFDAAVRAVTVDSDYSGMSFADQLAEAHAQLEWKAGRIGLEGVPPTKKAAPTPQPTPEPKKAEDKPDDMRTPPKTLANIPASEISSQDDSPFASLQALIDEGDSDKIESAFAKMTPEQRDHFASMDI